MAKSRLEIVRPARRGHSHTIPVARRVQGIKPYATVSSRQLIAEHPDRAIFKIDWNEATVPPSPKVVTAITEFLQTPHHLNWYPELNSIGLTEKLGQFHSLRPEQFLVTNGSDDGLNTLCTTYLDDEDCVLVASPTYLHFLVFVQARGATVAHHYGRDPFKTDLEGLIKRADQTQPRLIYLANPNNPTGVTYTNAQLADLLEAHPNSLVIVDEAYSEFAGESAVELLHSYSNLVISRTFSKAYGMAGLRVGYLMADPRIVEDLRRVFNPKNVNALAQVGAAAALEDHTWLSWYLDEVNGSKELINAWFGERDLTYRMTPGNFFMVKLDHAPWVVRRLQEEGVYIRDRSSIPSLAGYVRFSIGTREQTVEVLERFASVLDAMSI
jgi:histidinol-phosphate aminotransferase